MVLYNQGTRSGGPYSLGSWVRGGPYSLREYGPPDPKLGRTVYPMTPALRMTKKFLVSLPPYRRILDKNDENDMESAVRPLFSDRELIHNSVLQVVRLQQVSVLYNVINVEA